MSILTVAANQIQHNSKARANDREREASLQLYENHKSQTTRSKTLHSQQACNAADFELSAWFEVAANCRECAGEERRLRAINLLMCRLPQPSLTAASKRYRNMSCSWQHQQHTNREIHTRTHTHVCAQFTARSAVADGVLKCLRSLKLASGARTAICSICRAA